MPKTEYIPYQSGPTKQPGAQRLSVTKPFELAKFKLNGALADWRPTEWEYDPVSGLPRQVTCYSSTCNVCGSLCEARDLVGEVNYVCGQCQPVNRRTVRIVSPS